jgi:hypothetical protein
MRATSQDLLQDPFARNAGFWMSHGWNPSFGRQLGTGKVAFSVRRDLPAWEVLTAQVRSIEAA